eukprot:m51a1_g7017 putative C-tail anchored protein (272) ;mRNA; f:25425-26756
MSVVSAFAVVVAALAAAASGACADHEVDLLAARPSFAAALRSCSSPSSSLCASSPSPSPPPPHVALRAPGHPPLTVGEGVAASGAPCGAVGACERAVEGRGLHRDVVLRCPLPPCCAAAVLVQPLSAQLFVDRYQAQSWARSEFAGLVNVSLWPTEMDLEAPASRASPSVAVLEYALRPGVRELRLPVHMRYQAPLSGPSGLVRRVEVPEALLVAHCGGQWVAVGAGGSAWADVPVAREDMGGIVWAVTTGVSLASACAIAVASALAARRS